MSFIETVATQASNHADEIRVKSVIIGLSYCYVRLENDQAGLAFVFKDDLVAGCNIGLPHRPLAGALARDLLGFAGKGHLANSVCLATANAVLSPLVKPDTQGDFINHFSPAPGSKVGMVGHFRPLVPMIREKGGDLIIFDMHPDPMSGILEPDRIPDILPECEVALITGTSIINETFDDILSHAAQCKTVVVLGPSSPLASICYEGMPVTGVSGAIVRDLAGTEQAVAEAGGMRILSPMLDKVNVTLGK